MSPFTRVCFLKKHNYQDEANVFQKHFISYLLNISNYLLILFIIMTILTIYVNINEPTFDDGVIVPAVRSNNVPPDLLP